MAEYRQKMKVAMQARRTVVIPATTRELAKPYADHVENITVRRGDPFKRTETHQKSEKE
jgi:hypothetical protein